MQAPEAKPLTTVRAALEPWCAAGATGALRVQGGPSGSIFLVGGRVTGAECPLVSATSQILTSSGRITPDGWRSALSAARASGAKRGDVLTELVRAGLTPAEVVHAAMSAFYSALYLIADAAAEVRFDMGTSHSLLDVIDLDLATVMTEVDRRRAALDQAWPDASVDTSPIAPVPRLNGQHVALTGLQWEVVVNSGRGRTPLSVARFLGRDTYAMVLSARQLIRAGLLETQAPERGQAQAIEVAPAEPTTIALLPRRPVANIPDGLELATAPITLDAAIASDPRWSDSTLTRIRDALRAL